MLLKQYEHNGVKVIIRDDKLADGSPDRQAAQLRRIQQAISDSYIHACAAQQEKKEA